MQQLLVGNQNETVANARAMLKEGWRIVSVQLFALESRSDSEYTRKNNKGEPITHFLHQASIVLEKED